MNDYTIIKTDISGQSQAISIYAAASILDSEQTKKLITKKKIKVGDEDFRVEYVEKEELYSIEVIDKFIQEYEERLVDSKSDEDGQLIVDDSDNEYVSVEITYKELISMLSQEIQLQHNLTLSKAKKLVKSIITEEYISELDEYDMETLIDKINTSM